VNCNFRRPFVAALARRLEAHPILMQVLVGPRQVGKTTGVKQVIEQADHLSHYANADGLLASDHTWLREQWQQALLLGQDEQRIIERMVERGLEPRLELVRINRVGADARGGAEAHAARAADASRQAAKGAADGVRMQERMHSC
jgi:hypothetical protein